MHLTRSIRDSETSIDFVQGPPGSRRERVKCAGIEVSLNTVRTTFNHNKTQCTVDRSS